MANTFRAIFFEQQNEIELFEKCFTSQLPLLLQGPTGCGKSQLVGFMAERLRVPLIQVACNEDTNAADLLGRFLLKGGETVWQDGPVTRAVRQGGILYLDEIAEAREDVIVALHPLTDHRREIFLDKVNETVRAPEQFLLVASYNPGYQRGLKELKPSTRQRFVSLVMGYLPEADEARLLKELTGLDSALCGKIAKLANRIRSSKDLGLKETVSTRLLVHTAKLIQAGQPSRRAARAAIADVLTDEIHLRQALRDLIDLSL